MATSDNGLRTTPPGNPSTDANNDPLTGAPGAHPVGTGVGATGGAVAGAAIGSAAGPVGAAIGLVVGAVAGGLGGKAAAEGINPTAEDAYWRESYNREPYYEAGRSYDDYRPAYEMGWSSRVASDADFDTSEAALEREWNTRRGSSSLDWPQARNATRAAWDRVDRTYQDSRVTSGGSSTAAAAGGLGTAAVAGSATTDRTDVVDVLNDLLETSRNGEEGFRSSAEEVTSPELKRVFSERAEQCGQAARELAELVRRNGGTPAEGGTIAGALHRGWVHTKGAVGANSDESILNETERGEDLAVASYRKALKQNLPADVRAVVERQAQGAQRNHDQIKALRDQARARNT